VGKKDIMLSKPYLGDSINQVAVVAATNNSYFYLG
jgi:hypothetical protein